MKPKKYSCPYCLYTAEIHSFYVSKYHKKRAMMMFKCPDCGASMRRKTLTRSMTLHDYARWLYGNIRDFKEKFINKVNWDKIKERLWEHYLSSLFWAEWKEAKKEYPNLVFNGEKKASKKLEEYFG